MYAYINGHDYFGIINIFEWDNFRYVAKEIKARVYDRSLAGIAGSNPAGDVGGCPL
jgi:hypothetical protein